MKALLVILIGVGLLAAGCGGEKLDPNVVGKVATEACWQGVWDYFGLGEDADLADEELDEATEEICLYVDGEVLRVLDGYEISRRSR